MIQPVSVPRSSPITTASRGASSPSVFALSLAVVPDGDTPGDPPAADPAVPITSGNARQDAANDGSDLPNGDAPVDPRLAWLAMPVATPLTIVPATPATPAATLVATETPNPTIPGAAPPLAGQPPIPHLPAPTKSLTVVKGESESDPAAPSDSTDDPATASPDPASLIAALVPSIPIAIPAPVAAGATSVSSSVAQNKPSLGPVTRPVSSAAAALPVATSAPAAAIMVEVPPTLAAPVAPSAAPIAVPAAGAPSAAAITTAPVQPPVQAAAVPTPDPALTAAGPLPIALPDPSRPTTATPAIQAFAGAMRAGWRQEARTGRPDDGDPLAPMPTASLAPLDTVRHAVAATGAAQEQTLDTRREHWPAQMIDHIEALRDAADATSSKIRVAPDALGTIDLSVKRDGDTIHVHFDAEQAATRTMLADAQPRLAEIAQSRGLRLGDTNVGSGGNGQPQAQQQRAAATPPIPIPIPIPAPPRTTVAAGANDSIRIA